MRISRFALAVAVVFALAGFSFAASEEEAAPEEGVGGSDFHKNDITYSTEVETPHVDWAPKLPGGPIKGFFIPSVQYGRDMVELMQRLPLEPTTVSIDRNWDTSCWGIGDYYGHQYRGDRDDFRTVYGYVERDLTSDADFEVIVIPGLNGWTRMTTASRDAILERVENGAGLVLIHPFVGDVEGHPFEGDPEEGDERVWEVSPLMNCPDDFVNDRGYPVLNESAISKGKWEKTGGHFITSGIDLSLLPEGTVGGRYYEYEAADDAEVLVTANGSPVVAVKTFGEGRVVSLGYVNHGFIPEEIDPIETGIYWDYWEYYYSLLSRAVVWAAGRDMPVEITSLEVGPAEDPVVELGLSSETPRQVEMEVTAKSAYGGLMARLQATADLPAPQRTEFRFAPQHGWPAGKVYFDCIVRDAESGETLNWASAAVERAQPATFSQFDLNSEVYREGEAISTDIRCAGDLEGLTLRLKVEDELGRLVSSREKRAAAYNNLVCPLGRKYVGQRAFVTAELLNSGGAVVAQKRAEPVMVVDAERREKKFRPQMSFAGRGRHFFNATRIELLHEGGTVPGKSMGAPVSNTLNIPKGVFGVYWYDRGPTSEEGQQEAIEEYEKSGDFESLEYLVQLELYKRTGDKKFLTRQPCFDDPEFMSELYNICRSTARDKAKYNFDYYFVGDEGSITSYSNAVDFCWGPHTLSAFRGWLQEEYGSLDALNAEWQTEFADWANVVPYTTDEAREAGNFAPWADHRTYMEITFADAYRTVREATREGDPDGHIALSGTQRTRAYNGCDWYRLDRIIDDFLAYGGGNQWDLHRSFAKPGAMVGYWTGYGSSGMAVRNAVWSAAVHNVLHPNIFWVYSYLDPDFTYSKSARDMGKAFKSLRFEGVGKALMEAERLHDGIALHFSMPSVHAASITYNQREDNFPRERLNRNFEADRDGWVNTIKDLGMQFEFVSYDEVEQGALASGEYRVFILPFSLALSPEEAEAIRNFAENGGIVIADGAAGLMNEHCSWVADGMLNDLFGILAPDSSERKLEGATGEVEVTDTGREWGLEEAELRDLEALEPGIEAGAGTALLEIGATAAAVVNEVGEGKAIFLNVLYDRYPELRSKNYGGEAYRLLAEKVLAHEGVEPAVAVDQADATHLDQSMVARYRLGDSELLAVVKENVGLKAVEGRDGVTVYFDEEGGRVAKERVIIRLGQERYVTNVRTGENLGRTRLVETEIPVGGCIVFGLSPTQNQLEVSGPATAALGDMVEFEIASAEESPRVVRCHFFGPEGDFLALYQANVRVDGGQATVTLPSALSDPAGEYRLEATDLLSGASAEATVTLE